MTTDSTPDSGTTAKPPPTEGTTDPPLTAGKSQAGKVWRTRLKGTLYPWLLRSLTAVLWKTCKITDVIGQEHPASLLATGKPAILCYWHQQQIFCLRQLLTLQAQGLSLGYLISPSADGDVAIGLVKKHNIHIIRGSASRGGAQVMREIFTAIRQYNISPIITPDGPRGPEFECKPGVAMLSQLSGLPMLPMAYCASRFWQLRSWDRFIVPKPFARIVVGFGPPLMVRKGLPVDELEQVCQEMTQRINAVVSATRAKIRQA